MRKQAEEKISDLESGVQVLGSFKHFFFVSSKKTIVIVPRQTFSCFSDIKSKSQP
jgi:hypothetical protein